MNREPEAAGTRWARWDEFKERIAPWRKLGVREFPNGAVSFGDIGGWSGDHHCAFALYEPLSEAELALVEERIGAIIPESLRRFYRCSNGAELFGALSIFGYVETLSRDPGGPGRAFDLYVENILRPVGAFIFGGVTSWSSSAKLGMWPDGAVRLINEEDLSEMPKTWLNFDNFIFSEVDRLNVLHRPDGRFLGRWAEFFPPEAAHLERRRPNGRVR